jgi:hypothetical protein
LSPLTTREHVIGSIAGIIVGVIFAAALIGINSPQPPYNVRDRVWKTYDDARKAQVVEAATSQFQTTDVPFLIFMSLFPASVAYFVARETAATPKTESIGNAIPAVSSG